MITRLAGIAVALGLVGREWMRGRPPPISLAARLASIPLRGAPVGGAVTIHWDAHQIPFVEAACDDDLAVALGVVHAHLRLAQMEIMRRVALGRVAEMVGPLGIEPDRALRLMGFARAAPALVAALPEETRRFAGKFLAGVNHHLTHVAVLPREFALLGLAREPWTLVDFFAMARLAAADVSWLVFARLLRARRRFSSAQWAALWPRLLGAGEPAPGDPLLGQYVRGASNCAAVSGARSRSGAGMIASDPHLALSLPNLWLIAGVHSPSTHAVGLMLAGFPFIALGRNRWIGWGGTNLHAASSDLFDVSALPAEAFTVREERIAVRGGRSRRLRLRETPLGPVVSEGMLFRSPMPLALRWVGQRPSDEMGALLALARARTIAEARAALAGFAVPGQTMLIATAEGRIGRVRAAHLPRRAGLPEALVADSARAWPLADFAVLAEMPESAPEGLLVSANERPDETGLPIGYFFSPGDRAARMRELLGGVAPLSADDLLRMQTDTAQPAALALRDALLRHAPAAGLSGAGVAARRAFAAWDGHYAAGSAGALVFEAVVADLSGALPGPRRLAPLAGLWSARALMAAAILASPATLLGPAMTRALDRAGRLARRWGNWGSVHRLHLAHGAGRVPLIGARFRFGVFAAAGSNDTLNKTGHGMVRGRHAVTYGASARHVSDLARRDANFFVLLGGQDGWLGSANFLDQVPLWRAGRTIAVPLALASVRARFPHRTVLAPPS